MNTKHCVSFELAKQLVEIGRVELMIALVQAYYTDRNKSKVVDPWLMQDIAQAILELLKGEK